ncbi:hypothetical protein, unlikely [Trypanosoma brucei gambiense DAL972]|uniref:Uncharacterized protein n=1 Tax=Trypanosoma brucei gambiense (strain MHOM/CI/86/DAL972) TaxID=679716 RepID=C9ZZQ5_TRYB9|nr:hypothetical protein, unlikely [Trypanosoma brucei gambiense DAL972]CBH14904.1 hypothetical protein, unlikely [Trypanosoma brucei gambiense DAL972]|eukprot:XP_011777170.1 hypothetical protein, unlikely [Trypanosoma brucei gambiense DAL972]
MQRRVIYIFERYHKLIPQTFSACTNKNNNNSGRFDENRWNAFTKRAFHVINHNIRHENIPNYSVQICSSPPLDSRAKIKIQIKKQVAIAVHFPDRSCVGNPLTCLPARPQHNPIDS